MNAHLELIKNATKNDRSVDSDVRYYAEDIGSLLAIANVGLLLELPGVRKELRTLRDRCRQRYLSLSAPSDKSRKSENENDQFRRILQATERQVQSLLKAPITQRLVEKESGPTPQTKSKHRRDWLAMWRRSGQPTLEEAEAIDLLIPLWTKLRKGLGAASFDPERLLSNKVRRSYLQPLERLQESESQITLKVWVPWAKTLKQRDATRSNLTNVSVLELVEILIFDGASTEQIDRRFGLPRGHALFLLRQALQEFYRKAKKLVDNQE